MISQIRQSYSTSFPMWMSLRFITGLFTSSAYGVTYTYVLELLTERHRMLLGVINSITFGIGTMYLSLLAYLFNDWRSLARAIALTPGNSDIFRVDRVVQSLDRSNSYSRPPTLTDHAFRP